MAETIGLIFLIVVMAISAITDVKKRIIPNRLIIPSIGLALFFQIIEHNVINIILAFIAFMLLSILYTINSEFVGGGDIKLLVFVVLMLGPSFREYIYLTAGFTMIVWVFFFIKEKLTQEKQILPLALSMFLAIVTQLIMGLY